MMGKRLKDFYRFVRSVESFTDKQAKVVDWDEAELKEIKVQIQPNDGPYEGGRFLFVITLSEEFPECKPDVYCETMIYHPNIDPTSDSENVCLNLFDKWTSTFGLRDVIQGLLFLFYNPNLEDPLSSYFGETLDDDEFADNVKASLRGEDVEGYEFPYNYYGDKDDMKVKVETTKGVPEESSSEKASDTTEENTPKDLVAEEDPEQNVKEIPLILEKVSELMLEHPEEKEQEACEEKNTGETSFAESDNCTTTQANIEAENVTNSANCTEQTDSTFTVDTNVLANCDTLNTVEIANGCDNVIVAERSRSDNIFPDVAIQRQSSKLDRQNSNMEATAAATYVEGGAANNTKDLDHCMQRFRMCSFIAPDIDHMCNMFGAVCYYVYKKYLT